MTAREMREGESLEPASPRMRLTYRPVTRFRTGHPAGPIARAVIEASLR